MPGNNNETTTKFKVDISELKKSMQDAKRSIALANSEFKATASSMDDWGNSADGVSAKIKQLGSNLKAQKNILSSLESQLDLTVKQYGENSKEADQLRIAINNQRTVINNTERELANYSDKLEELQSGNKDGAKSSKKLGDSLDDVKDSAESAGDGFTTLKGAIATFAGNALTGMVNGIKSGISSMIGLADETREYRTEMGKLETAFTSSGFSADTASKTYKDFYAVLGDEGQATEAVSHLAKLATTEEDLAKWTDIATGVYGTFGDSLPIEGLTEASNETAKTGQLTGSLADALNWAGVSEEDFQESLDGCTSEQERQALITDTLTGLYQDASKTYKEVNGDIMDAQRAQSELADATAKLGGVAEPVMTSFKLMGAELINSLLPNVEALGQGFSDLINGVDGAEASIGTAVGGIIEAVLNKITSILPQLTSVAMALITTLIESILGALPNLITAIVDMVGVIIEALSTALPEIALAIVEIVPKIIDALMSQLPTFITACIDFLMAIVEAIPSVVQAIITAIPQIIDSIVTGLSNGIDALITGAISLFTAIVDAIPQIIPMLVEAIPQIVNGLVNGLLTLVPQLLQGAISLLMAIVDAIPVIIPAIVSAIPQIVTSVITALVTAIPQLLQGAISFLMAIIQAIPTIIVELVNQLPNIITTILDTLLTAIPQLLECATTLFMTLVEAIPTIIAELVKSLPQIIATIIEVLFTLIPKLVSFLADVLGMVIEWLADLVVKCAEGIGDFVETFVEFIKELPGKAKTWLTNVIDKVIEWGVSMTLKSREAGKNFINNVINFVKELPGKIKTWLTNVITNVTSWASNLGKKAKEAGKALLDNVINSVKELPTKIKTVGSDVVKGLWNGINDMASWVKDKIKGFGDTVLNGIKDFFGIHSPSRVMRDEVGKNLAIGVADGVNNNAKYAGKSMAKMGELILDEAETTLKDYKKINDMSLQDEVAYWAEIKRSVGSGTEASRKVEQKYLEAKKKLTDEEQKIYEDAEKNVEKYYKETTNLYDDLMSDIDKVVAKYEDSVTSRAESISSSLKLFDKFEADDALSKADLSANLRSQVEALSAWDDTLNKLSKREGMDDDLMSDLEAMGVDNLDTLKQLNSMSDRELSNYVKLYKRKNQIALQRSITENEALKAQSQQEISELIRNAKLKMGELQTTYSEELKLLQISAKDESIGIGYNVVTGIQKGITDQRDQLQKYMENFLQGIVKDAKVSLGIASPSKVFAKEVGKWIPEGIAVGITDNAGSVLDSIKSLANTTVGVARDSLTGANSSLGAQSGTVSGGVVNNYNQVINSPKALTRLEIYRQSKNLLGYVGGGVSVHTNS